MGLAPEMWGPYVWAAIHLMCLDGKAEAEAYVALFAALSRTLPCKKCREHLGQHLRKMPAITRSEDAFAWSVDLHNEVNKMLNKPVMGLEEARQFWTSVAKGHTTLCDKKKGASKASTKAIVLALCALLAVAAVVWVFRNAATGRRKS